MTTNEKPADADLLRFVGLMEERLGLYFDAAEHNRVGILMHERMRESGCSSFSGYEQRMCDGSGEELRVLASKLTVPETYFFRNPEQFVALAQSVMPQLRLGQPARRIRILSVGCSSGEEPFTIAMTLKEMPDFDLSLVSIIGIDVNPKCIEKGRRGRFAKWSMRTMPEHYKKYLRPNHNEFALDEGVRDGAPGGGKPGGGRRQLVAAGELRNHLLQKRSDVLLAGENDGERRPPGAIDLGRRFSLPRPGGNLAWNFHRFPSAAQP